MTSLINSIKDEPLVIGIVAGEVSGDKLGADFMRQMNAITDKIQWVGVGGEHMQAQGLHSLFDMSRLSVMGLFEVLKHLPDLLKARRELLKAFSHANIDCFIGIDAPDFNLKISKPLKERGVFCTQYVSPSIWAWREKRIHNIKQSTDLVLCLFPFELTLYHKYDHPAICVGHPLLNSIDKYLLAITDPELRRDLAWQIPVVANNFSERRQGVSKIVCVMPGSRRGEIKYILPVMLRALEQLLNIDDGFCFIIPTVNPSLQLLIQNYVDKCSVRVQNAIVVACDPSQKDFSQQIMAISDIVLLSSGTATLEAMLLNRPMVVVYKLNELTYHFVKNLMNIPYVALPNILSNKAIVSEFIQDEATSDAISKEAWKLLSTKSGEQQCQQLKEASEKLYQDRKQSPAHAFIDHLTTQYQ